MLLPIQTAIFIFLSGQEKSKKVPQLNWKQNLLPALTLYDVSV